MTSLAIALKDEIRRLARKEIKQHTGATAQAVARYRREIAQLKRQTRELEKKIAFLETQERKRLDEKPRHDVDQAARFSARSVKAQRRRTGLSATDYARLVGVSALTIYNWEHGKTRPRQEQLAALVALRSIGKREAQAKLELLKNGAQRASSKAGQTRRK
ncbi:MAG: helix-turn-helix transcriptional regulator [Pirellulales bacterium]